MKYPLQSAIGAVAVLLASAWIQPARADLFTLTDANLDPKIFECTLTAVESDVSIGASTVHIFTYKDEGAAPAPASAGIPVQVMKVKVGDRIICHFKNSLSVDSASIHWHGIELDNDSDGTAVTQDAVLPGQSYTYQFIAFRPGTFWFHSHMLPGNTLFGGMYGVMIVENNIEPSLIDNGTLPGTADTFNLALSDIEFDPATGKVGKQIGSSGPFFTENELIELCHLDGIGDPGGNNAACNASTRAGNIVLVNGQTPVAAAQTPKFIVPSGKKIRLRLLNESISRNFRLKLLNSGDNKIYRIGGQGGLLDNVLLEGGIKGTFDTKFDVGEINLGSGMRADTVIFPTRPQGTIIQLVGNPLTAPFSVSTVFPADYPIAYFQISGTASDTPPAAGDPILAGTAEDIENIKTISGVVPLVDPVPPPFAPGSSDETIRLTTATPTGPGTFVKNQPSVDQFAAPFDSNLGNGDFLLIAPQPTSRYAKVGDLLELTVRNETGAVHPYHLHGFSMQPVRFVDNTSGSTLFDFDYDEFLDTIDVYAGQSYVFRVRLDDRPTLCDLTPTAPPDPGPVLAECTEKACGGAVGRWLFHCHIVSHGALGMIGELHVLPGTDAPPAIACPANVSVNNDPGQCSALVNFETIATDDCGDPAVVCSPASGTAFPAGTTKVTCTATDTASQTAQCSFDVTVTDNEAPKITVSVAAPALSPPDHNLVNVGLNAVVTDNCPDGIVTTVKVFGDEDDESQTGDGNFSPDAKDIANATLRLRAERAGSGDGRVYLIIVTATDASGNKTTACQTVVVAQSQSKASIALVNAQAAAAQAFCEAQGAPPPGFVLIGDGPTIGPKQ